MAEPHVISALVKKRAELLGEIQYHEKLLKSSKENLTHIDRTIKMFDENYNLSDIKAKRVHREKYFKTGEAKLLILDILRVTTEPISTTDIGKKIAHDKGIDEKEDFNLEHFLKVILASLGRCESNNLIERVGKDGLAILWQIKRD
jgi:hypothetical protein